VVVVTDFAKHWSRRGLSQAEAGRKATIKSTPSGRNMVRPSVTRTRYGLGRLLRDDASFERRVSAVATLKSVPVT
jgi:hypothetical protein